MRLHKQTCNRFLALHYLWSMSETTNFHFYDYLQMAKEEILSLDKQFVMVRNAYLDQLKLSEYKNKMWCQGEQYSKQRRISYLRNKLRWNQNICVDIYEDRLNNLIQKYHFNISSEEVIAYFTIQEENIVVLSKERLYSNLLKKDIPLEDLICLRMDEQRKVYALYRTGERQIAIQGNGVGLTTLIECINEWTLYL